MPTARAVAGMSRPLAELRGIVKAFPGVVANAGVDLAVYAGEVLAVLGENGAGKTTLMSVLAGHYRPDAGTIVIDGTPVVLRSPGDALARGVGMVHQQFRLVGAFTVTENVLLGWREPRFLLHVGGQGARVRRLAAAYGLAVEPHARLDTLSLGERQRVEILRMLYRDVRVLVLDEPTAVLTPPEVAGLVAALRRIAAEGRAVVFISHKLDEVMEVADRIVVLRAGRVAGVTTPGETTPRALARLMVGREVETAPRSAAAPGPVLLGADGITLEGPGGRGLRGITLQVRGGEIVGVAGVAGNGQRELAEVLAGLRTPQAGRVAWHGRDITHLGPRARWALGLAYVPEDRLGEGLVGAFTVAENAVLRDYDGPPVTRGPWLSWPVVRARASALVTRFSIRTPSVETAVRHLSGGHQQRLLVGREVGAAPQVLIAMYATRGLDVQAAAAVHRILLDLRAAGAGVLLISESLEELFAVADRITVMHRGRLVGERPAATATREEIGLLMAGGALPRW
ncbi:MAG: ABC transporter ATP-binding protein [Armatimonadota bacterium]|nr:ABC transporter ATP-binding protein [Armatimonadota bacterium]